MKASELIHGGLYLIHDASDIVVRYDITSNSFRSEWYEYHLTLFHDDVCAADNDRFIFVKPIPLTAEIFEKNGIVKAGKPYEYEQDDWIQRYRYGYNFDMLHSTRDGFLWKGVSLEYVHELQYALRLCGLHDLADNFKVE